MKKRESDPGILREKAQALLRRAREIEEKKFIQAGKLVHQHYKADFKDLDMETFKAEIRQVFEAQKKKS